ncbi:hypothetical protein Y71_09720 [Kosakonia radicincitans DSM 16656]|nr:hypothetical protein Y71_09720 [Kosakonia radicincitans DSM 16656]
MSKTIMARFIRCGDVRFRDMCGSKFSPVCCKRDLRGYIRDATLTAADSMFYLIVDICVRMLQPMELYRTQGSPGWYIIV